MKMKTVFRFTAHLALSTKTSKESDASWFMLSIFKTQSDLGEKEMSCVVQYLVHKKTLLHAL